MTGKKLGADEVRRASMLGVQTCMVKPYGGADVLDRIAKLLKAGKSAPPADASIQPRPTPPGSMEVLL
ncbi:hypothetical protein BH10PSE3_BH10PSE3_17160 [soil metagenome]